MYILLRTYENFIEVRVKYKQAIFRFEKRILTQLYIIIYVEKNFEFGVTPPPPQVPSEEQQMGGGESKTSKIFISVYNYKIH